MRRSGRPRRAMGQDDVSASEAAAYTFCAKAWHLEHVAGNAPTAAAAERRAHGIRAHDRHGAQITRWRTRVRTVFPWTLVALVIAVALLILGVAGRGQ